MGSQRQSTHIEVEETLVRSRSNRRSASQAAQAQSQAQFHSQSQSHQHSSAAPQSTTSLARILQPNEDHGDSSRRRYKRLIVCCDGTWLDSSSSLQNGKLIPPSNVTRMCRAIRSENQQGIPQVVYYQAGVGSSGTLSNRIIGGAIGDGLAENVREAYAFLANNYIPGDEIFLIGFSRGAFTARSIGGLIGNIGVLTKAGLASFAIIYRDWTRRRDRLYRSPQRDLPYPNKPRASDPEYAEGLERRGLTTLDVRIKAITVADTVGALGVPKLGGLSGIGKRVSDECNEYRFYDTTLDNCIDNAFQALALDEKRSPFQPAIWEKRGNDRTNLIQVWFPGVHANIGGGYNDQELSNITLAWMMAMLAPMLDINLDYILNEEQANSDYYDRKGKRPRPWSFGKIYNSAGGVYTVAGTTARTPGNYYRLDPKTGEPTRKLLRDTNEYIHASVRSRYVMEGPGYSEKGVYDPVALRPFRLKSERDIQLPTPWFWEVDGPEAMILPEAPLRRVEKMLLKCSPDVLEYLEEPPPRGDRRSRDLR